MRLEALMRNKINGKFVLINEGGLKFEMEKFI